MLWGTRDMLHAPWVGANGQLHERVASCIPSVIETESEGLMSPAGASKVSRADPGAEMMADLPNGIGFWLLKCGHAITIDGILTVTDMCVRFLSKKNEELNDYDIAEWSKPPPPPKNNHSWVKRGNRLASAGRVFRAAFWWTRVSVLPIQRAGVRPTSLTSMSAASRLSQLGPSKL